jgi:KaiC/GvpD/RAD55 family RecA-like ATPase
MSETKQDTVWIEFHSPNEIKSFELPPNLILVGDSHIQRGAFCVIGGAPGVGKSRAAMALAIAGATGENWLDLQVPNKFRTMIIQNENGKARLKKDFETINCSEFEQYIRICSPPPYGMAFEVSEFVEALREKIKQFNPDVVIFDPWNSIVGDDKQSDYLKAFNLIRSVIPVSDTGAAIVIVAHTRKPRDEEKATGRDLMNLLSGSHVLVSVPRSVFVMFSESPEVDDDNIVWTCCKNNDGIMNAPTVWSRSHLPFEYVGEYDPKEQTGKKRITITIDDVKKVLQLMPGTLPRKQLVLILKKQTTASPAACYAALNPEGKFKDHIEENDGLLKWRD